MSPEARIVELGSWLAAEKERYAVQAELIEAMARKAHSRELNTFFEIPLSS